MRSVLRRRAWIQTGPGLRSQDPRFWRGGGGAQGVLQTIQHVQHIKMSRIERVVLQLSLHLLNRGVFSTGVLPDRNPTLQRGNKAAGKTGSDGGGRVSMGLYA
jgi:hypothetical protein